jgi:hypothetical protein
VQNLVITKVDVISSNIGDQSEQDSIDLLNSIIPKVLPPLNEWLTPFTIPNEFFGVTFTDLTLQPRAGYLYAGLACDFTQVTE